MYDHFWTVGIKGLFDFLPYSIFWGENKGRDLEHFQVLVNDLRVNAISRCCVIRFRKINDLENEWHSNTVEFEYKYSQRHIANRVKYLRWTLREKCPNTELFLVRYYFVNLRIQSEYKKIRTRNNSVFGHFSQVGAFVKIGNSFQLHKKCHLIRLTGL